MRYFLLLAVVLLALGGAPAARSADAYALAQRQEAEEQARRVNAKLNSLEEALQAYQHEITILKADIRSLREELARSRNRTDSAASQESIKQLAASIQEVDRKRLADHELVLAEFRKLGKQLTTTTTKPPGTERTLATPPRTPSDKDSEYTIRSKDTLVEIVKLLNEQGVKVTQTDIEKANPKVNWKKLQINQKIIIPAPAPAP